MAYILFLTIPAGPVVERLQADLCGKQSLEVSAELVGISFDKYADGQPLRLLTFRVSCKDPFDALDLSRRYKAYVAEPWESGRNPGRLRHSLLPCLVGLISLLDDTAPVLLV